MYQTIESMVENTDIGSKCLHFNDQDMIGTSGGAGQIKPTYSYVA